LNRRRIDPDRYYKLEENDVLQFGESSKEFLLDSDSSHKHNNDSKRSHKHHENKSKSSDEDE
ncbi:unnamed protein product, partial [Rotaria magnacalcarata]